MSATVRQATAFQLIDAAKNGIPIPPKLLLEYIPLINRAETFKMMDEAEKNQKPEPPKTSLTISFKDLPVEAQAAILQSQGMQVSPQSIMQQEMMDMQMKNIHQMGKQPMQNPQGIA